MFKHALAAGTLVASTLIVGLTVSAQPAGASATQESAATSENSSASGNFFIDPFNPYGYGRVYYNTLGYGQVYYNPFSYGQVYYNPYTIYRW
ncbi:hypothetical protein [Streptosporangium lutulentum]|uniref:Uncharacterized protein n=1 Tax=Streptosporangium lutulentum TaxID=1461250 RepID=A0ABT9QBW6_9ACTN|nr:hypothetical protein [Streptosporangium lutulentum]MDP9844228.1 hypothetical protein [Streptosporangium lutulentum]